MSPSQQGKVQACALIACHKARSQGRARGGDDSMLLIWTASYDHSSRMGARKGGGGGMTRPSFDLVSHAVHGIVDSSASAMKNYTAVMHFCLAMLRRLRFVTGSVKQKRKPT